MFWGCFRYVLGMVEGYFGELLVTCWGCFRDVFGMFWECFRCVLDICSSYFPFSYFHFRFIFHSCFHNFRVGGYGGAI